MQSIYKKVTARVIKVYQKTVLKRVTTFHYAKDCKLQNSHGKYVTLTWQHLAEAAKHIHQFSH